MDGGWRRRGFLQKAKFSATTSRHINDVDGDDDEKSYTELNGGHRQRRREVLLLCHSYIYICRGQVPASHNS